MKTCNHCNVIPSSFCHSHFMASACTIGRIGLATVYVGTCMLFWNIPCSITLFLFLHLIIAVFLIFQCHQLFFSKMLTCVLSAWQSAQLTHNLKSVASIPSWIYTVACVYCNHLLPVSHKFWSVGISFTNASPKYSIN